MAKLCQGSHSRADSGPTHVTQNRPSTLGEKRQKGTDSVDELAKTVLHHSLKLRKSWFLTPIPFFLGSLELADGSHRDQKPMALAMTSSRHRFSDPVQSSRSTQDWQDT